SSAHRTARSPRRGSQGRAFVLTAASLFLRPDRRAPTLPKMDKQFLVAQLVERLRESVHVARKAGEAAAEEARAGATPAEKREDARVSMENAGLARGQQQRADRAAAEVSLLETFRPRPLPARAPIALGAVVEVEDGSHGRTFFLAPAGAGVELTGP